MIGPRTSEMSSARMQRLTLMLPIGAVLVSLLLAEIVLRIAGYGDEVRYQYLPDIGWVHRPNQHALTVGRKAVRINSFGLRGPNLPLGKPDGVFRILLLGDSFTFGYGVEDDSTYGRQLERLFVDQPAECGRIEVLNAGVNGYNTSQELAWLRRSGLNFRPDLVILAFTPNDIMTENEGKRMLRWPLLKELLSRSALYQFAAPRLKALVYRKAGKAYQDTLSLFLQGDAAVDSRVEGLRAQLAEFHQAAVSHDFQPVLVVFPFAEQVIRREFQAWPPPAIEQQASSDQLPLLDLLPVFRDAVDRGESVYLNEPTRHPNGRGHQITADSLYAFLGNHRLLPDCGPHPKALPPGRVARATP